MRARSSAAAVLLLAAACSRGAVPRDPDPRNELPFGYVDVPANGSTVRYQMPARGWALDDGSVSEVRIFLDNHFVGRTTITESRPDVVKAYPAFAHGSDVHGWTVTVPLGADTPAGPHTILVQAVDNQGATRDIGTSTVELRR
jgi:hypothetical protein